ncbi:MAG: hypothetical protein JRE28_12695 [Deltaproteobacteria bacterium]|nr:hypothetical protein [Deltaproteobacteria bacterium]
MMFRCCISILISGVLFWGTCFAQDSGLTNGKNVFKVDIEYQYREFDLDLTKSNVVTPQWNEDYESPYERNMVFLGASYGIFDKLDVLVGLGFLEDEWTADRRDNTTYDHIQKGSDNILWKVGLKYNLVKFDSGIYIGGLATYSQWDSGDESYYTNGVNDPKTIEALWEEFAVSLYTGMQIKDFSPYVGVEYTDVEVTQKLSNYPLSPNVYGENEYEIEDNWGIVAGMTYSISQHFNLNLKTRLINQNSYSFGIAYKF